MRKLAIASLLFVSLHVVAANTQAAIIIDLNDFYASPTVSVAPDGSSATLREDPSSYVVLLANDPGLGEPEVIIAGPGVSLIFDYDLVQGPTDYVDEFGAFVLGFDGRSAGTNYEFFADTTSSGTVSFDLSGLTAEPFIGLQFQLTALMSDCDLSSVVTISHVRLDGGEIPEPASVAIWSILAAFGLVAYRRRASRA